MKQNISKTNSKLIHLNKRIPVIEKTVTPEVKFITPKLLSGIKENLKKIEELAHNAADTLESWVDHAKKYDIKRLDNDTIKPFLYKALMSNGAILRMIAIDALNQAEALIERARKSITDSERTESDINLEDLQ